MRINGREIGPGHAPWICAEVSGEHKGSYDRCVDLIDAAHRAGADSVKLQCFRPYELAKARGGPDKVLAEGLWAGRKLIDLYTETHTPREWFPDLFAYARRFNITLFSSVFDEEGVEFLETLGCPAYKVSSFSATDLALIRKAASTVKPLIISTGMASGKDIDTALAQCPNFSTNAALLHCVSAYPCPIEDANLERINKLWDFFEVTVTGLSDHTLGTTAAIVATALGASIIEKHITLDRSNGGPDAAFSLEPHEFKKLVQDVKDAYASLGTGERPQSESIYRSLRHKGGE
jgi:sialic acid synthase SpsE